VGSKEENKPLRKVEELERQPSEAEKKWVSRRSMQTRGDVMEEQKGKEWGKASRARKLESLRTIKIE